MLLPDIAPGKRFALPRPPGSADALLLARFAEKERARAKVVAIFTAEPADAQRLADEIPFFAPTLRVAVFPDWETLPYDTFSPHEDLISERLATLWRIRRGDVDVVLMPATTALVRLAPPAFMAGYTFHFTTKQRAPGKRFALPRPPGSADALLLARFAETEASRRRACSAVFTAEPGDAQRLADELAFFAPALRVAVFPDWETLPYDSFSPHEDLISERLATLWRIRSGDVDVVLMPATTALVRLAPPGFIAGYTFHFKTKQRLDEAALKAQLTLAGYTHVSQVVSPGEYAVRGGLIDLFPMGSAVPYRVDLFGDEIDSIRTFDPDTQRSLYPVPEVRLLPGREFPMDEAARTAFRSRWREQLEGDPTKVRLYKDIGAGIATAGIEYYLPLFFDATATIFDYLGDAAMLVLHGEVDEALQRFWTDTRERYRFFQHDRERPVLPPESLFLQAGGVLRRLRPACAARAARPQRRGVGVGDRRCPTWAWTAAHPSR